MSLSPSIRFRLKKKLSRSELAARLTIWAWVLPPVAFIVVVTHQVIEHTVLRSLRWEYHFLSQVLFYGIIGPLLTWLTLNWITRRVVERDQAEHHLRTLYETSSRSARAPDLDALLDLAVELPGWVADFSGATVILKETPSSNWTLVKSTIDDPDVQLKFESTLNSFNPALECNRCFLMTGVKGDPLNCALGELHRSVGSNSSGDTPVLVQCVPLSIENPPTALLGVFARPGFELTPGERQTLNSLAASLATAMDNGRLRAAQVEMLARVERAVQNPPEQVATLEAVLQVIGQENRADSVAVFTYGAGETLVQDAVWPQSAVLLDLSVEKIESKAVVGDDAIAFDPESEITVLPLVVAGERVGAIVIIGGRPPIGAGATFLRAAASICALFLQNRQMLWELESVAFTEERARLASEVHDGLAQSLGFFNFKIQQIERLHSEGNRDEVSAALKELKTGSRALYTELRLAIQNLRWPAYGGTQPFADNVVEYVAEFGRKTGLDIATDCDPAVEISFRESAQLLRVLQEALTNVFKHAQATRAAVGLRIEDEHVVMTISDNGVGISRGGANGAVGLSIMEERVESIGGQLSIAESESGGVLVRVTLPATTSTSAREVVRQ